MINLLPPAIKEEISYAKRNAKVIRVMEMLIAALLLISLLLIGAKVTAQNRTKAAQDELQSIKETASENSKVESEAKTVSDQLKMIKDIRTGQRVYSAVLRDLANSLPGGTSIDQVTLADDAKKPLNLTVFAPNYSVAKEIRGALAAVDRVSAVDVISMSRGSDGQYSVELDIAFKPGRNQ